MTDPTRIRAIAGADNKTLVRVRMAHEMESGQRRDSAGKLVPAWHITDVTVSLNGRDVMTAAWGASVSKNPYLQFTLRGAKVGDRIAVAWKDSRGQSRRDEVAVSAA